MDGSSLHCIGGSDQHHPQGKKCKKTKWFSEEVSQIAVNRREAKSKGGRKDTHLNAEFQSITRRDKKAFLVINANKERKTIEWESLEILKEN